MVQNGGFSQPGAGPGAGRPLQGVRKSRLPSPGGWGGLGQRCLQGLPPAEEDSGPWAPATPPLLLPRRRRGAAALSRREGSPPAPVGTGAPARGARSRVRIRRPGRSSCRGGGACGLQSPGCGDRGSSWEAAGTPVSRGGHRAPERGRTRTHRLGKVSASGPAPKTRPVAGQSPGDLSAGRSPHPSAYCRRVCVSRESVSSRSSGKGRGAGGVRGRGAARPSAHRGSPPRSPGLSRRAPPASPAALPRPLPGSSVRGARWGPCRPFLPCMRDPQSPRVPSAPRTFTLRGPSALHVEANTRLTGGSRGTRSLGGICRSRISYLLVNARLPSQTLGSSKAVRSPLHCSHGVSLRSRHDAGAQARFTTCTDGRTGRHF